MPIWNQQITIANHKPISNCPDLFLVDCPPNPARVWMNWVQIGSASRNYRVLSSVRSFGEPHAVFDELHALAFKHIGDALDGPGIAGCGLPPGPLEADERAHMHA